MNNLFSKTPFLYLLIPLVGGILLQYYNQNIIWSIIFSLVGGLIILFSFFEKKFHSYQYRWVFGLGILFVFLAIGGFKTGLKQNQMEYALSDSIQLYVGYITETPQDKPRSVAHEVYLPDEDIKVICYLAKDSLLLPLYVGDEIAFMGKLQAFKNMGNPDDFDYERYMYNQGFVASTYLYSASWIRTGNKHQSLSTIALGIRQNILKFYSKLGFSEEEQAILAALTLGYQDTLSDDLKHAFRSTGTVHVLSASGLHVGIIYAAIVFLLSFLSRFQFVKRFRPLLIILLLWIYAFVTGLPPSVVRATIMLSFFCLSELVNRKNNGLNILFIAAFFMLLYNPFWLFDIGFQLSFISVLSILVLYKKTAQLVKVNNKLLQYVWDMFVISLVAQLATFPLCFYYFGTFPTYFFLANLIVVPLFTLIIYGMVLIGLVWLINFILPQLASALYNWLTIGIQQLVEWLTDFVFLFNHLPLSLIEGVNVSLLELLIIFFSIITCLYAILKSNSRSLIVSLLAITLLFSFNLYRKIMPEDNQLIICNRASDSEIIMIKNKKEYCLTDSLLNLNNPILVFDNKKVLFVNDIFNPNVMTSQKYEVDYLVVQGREFVSVDMLDTYYKYPILILDGSLSPIARQRLTKECEKRLLPYHDVTKKGAFTIFFTTFAD